MYTSKTSYRYNNECMIFNFIANNWEKSAELINRQRNNNKRRKKRSKTEITIEINFNVQFSYQRKVHNAYWHKILITFINGI